MKDDKASNIPKKIPMRVGESDQFLRGVVRLGGEYIHVKITVEDLESGDKCTNTGLAPAPLAEFCSDLGKWRASRVYPTNPSGGSRIIKERVLEPYWLRYRQAFESFGEGKVLSEARKALWHEYREAEGIAVHPITKIRKPYRDNFYDALNARLKAWKRSKEAP